MPETLLFPVPQTGPVDHGRRGRVAGQAGYSNGELSQALAHSTDVVNG